jgi:hypothetical protein
MFSGHMINELEISVTSDSSEILKSLIELILKKQEVIGYYFSEDGELCFCSSPRLSCSIFITPPSAESLKIMILEWLGNLEYPQSLYFGDGSIEKGWRLSRDMGIIDPPPVFQVSPAWIIYSK